MSERKYVKLSKLKIWTDNPRYGNLSDSASVMTERDAINLLIEVVGEKKMLNLVEDIINGRGLNANVIPTVVEKDGAYYVYDGNRRISSIKIIKNPQIIENNYSLLFAKINSMTEGLDLSFLDKVFVYATSEDEALSLMDKTHTGEQDGIGVIPWDAFNRDISLNHRSKPTKYPISFRIAVIMNWTKKKDFQIPYTDFQRLFSSKALLEAFCIEELSKECKRQIETAISALWAYKQERGFGSFSRQFNITETGDGSDSDKPINIFIDWWREKQKSESLYLITIETQTLFTDDVFEFDYSKIHITRRGKGSETIDFDKDELEIQFFDPSGKRKKELNPKIGGLWGIKAFYKGIVGNGDVLVKTVSQNPDVKFNDCALKIRKGESLNLESVIKYAKSIHENEMSLLSITSVDNKEPIINGRVFSSDNEVGNYILSFKFDNDGEEFSINQTLVVLPNVSPAVNNAIEMPFSFVGNSTITFSADVAKLIEEINRLWTTNQYRYVISCSARAVAELCLEYIECRDSTIFSDPKNLNRRIEELVDFLMINQTKLKDICNKMRLKYTNIRNQLVQLKSNANNVASALHLGAHKSASVLDSENLYSKIHVYVCLIVQIAEGFKLT